MLLIKDTWEDALKKIGKVDAIITSVGTSTGREYRESTFKKLDKPAVEKAKDAGIDVILATGWHDEKALEVAERENVNKVLAEGGFMEYSKTKEGQWMERRNISSEQERFVDKVAGIAYKKIIREIDKPVLFLQPDKVCHCPYVNPPRDVVESDLVLLMEKPDIERVDSVNIDASNYDIGRYFKQLAQKLNFNPIYVRLEGNVIKPEPISLEEAEEIINENPVRYEVLKSILDEVYKEAGKEAEVNGIPVKMPDLPLHDDNSFDILPYPKGFAVLNYVQDNGYKRVMLIEKGSGHESDMNRFFERAPGIYAVAFSPEGKEVYGAHKVPVPREELFATVVGAHLFLLYFKNNF